MIADATNAEEAASFPVGAGIVEHVSGPAVRPLGEDARPGLGRAVAAERETRGGALLAAASSPDVHAALNVWQDLPGPAAVFTRRALRPQNARTWETPVRGFELMDTGGHLAEIVRTACAGRGLANPLHA